MWAQHCNTVSPRRSSRASLSAAATLCRRSRSPSGSPTILSSTSKAAEAWSTAQSCASAAVRPGFARRARYRDGAPLSAESPCPDLGDAYSAAHDYYPDDEDRLAMLRHIYRAPLALALLMTAPAMAQDRKSTRLNSSH